MKRVLYTDPYTQKEVYMHQNSDGTSYIEQKQSFEGLVKLNRQMNNDYQKGNMIGNTQRHHQKVADIPNLLYVQLKEKFGHPADNPRDWARWLNDPDNRHFRTGGGRI